MKVPSILGGTTPFLLLGLAMLGLYACSDFGSEIEIGVTVDGSAVLVTNYTKDVMCCTVYGSRIAALVSWNPCRSTQYRQRILPGETVRVSYASIPRGNDENEVVVFCCKLMNVAGWEYTSEPTHVIVMHL
jgi:hypothetical protein